MTTKITFRDVLVTELAEQGFASMPFSKGTYALFFRRVGKLNLTLALETSTRSKGSFTGSLYLSPTFSWSYAPPDGFPPEAYVRIGQLLTPAERREVEPGATRQQVDVWWKGLTKGNARHFAAAGAKSATRLVSTEGLAEKVRTAPAVRELVQQLRAVCALAQRSPSSNSRHLQRVKRVPVVPECWYQAAAAVASQRFVDFDHKDGIEMLAEQAWLLHELG